MTKRKFLYNLSRASYEKNWGKDYQKPTLFERFIALLYRILPKFGPLRVLQLKTPTPVTETKFEDSFNQALDRLQSRHTPDTRRPGARRSERQFRYRQARSAGRLLHERRRPCAIGRRTGENKFQGHEPGAAGRTDAVLFRSKRAIRHEAQAEGMGQAAGRVATVQIRARPRRSRRRRCPLTGASRQPR